MSQSFIIIATLLVLAFGIVGIIIVREFIDKFINKVNELVDENEDLNLEEKVPPVIPTKVRKK